jgi:rod shape-determining protein MreD
MLIDYLKIILGIILAVLVQYFIVDQINFGPFIKPYVYLLGFLFLNFERNKYAQLGLAFFAGFFMDLLHQSYGMHTAASVATLYFKIKAEGVVLNTEAISLQGNHHLTPKFKGLRFYAIYIGLLIALHHLIFFSLDYYKWSSFLTIIISTASSTIVSLAFIHLIKTYLIRRE